MRVGRRFHTVVAGYRAKVSRIYFHSNARFTNPNVCEYPKCQGIKYAIRLPAKSVLQDRSGRPLKGPG